MVIVSRPYNGFDCGMNLNLPRKLRQLGVLAIPMDFLPLDAVGDLDEIKPMYWRFGQKILAAADLVRQDPTFERGVCHQFQLRPRFLYPTFFQRHDAGQTVSGN